MSKELIQLCQAGQKFRVQYHVESLLAACRGSDIGSSDGFFTQIINAQINGC